MANELSILVLDGEYRIDSRLVAASLGIDHKHFLETVRTYKAEFGEFGFLPFQTAKIIGRGRPESYALLNEDQAIFAGTLSRNSRQVVTFKLQLTKAFSQARARSQAPATDIHTLSDAMRARAMKNLASVPSGYFSVMGELFKHLYNLEAIIRQRIDAQAMIEISVGQHWSVYAREDLSIPDALRRKYQHICPNGQLVLAWAYPLHYVTTFDIWLWETYFPTHFPAYQHYRITYLTLQASRQRPLRHLS